MRDLLTTDPVVAVALIAAIGLIVAAFVAAVPPTLATLFARRETKRELGQIHVLVNSRLTEALNEIEKLREYIDQRSEGGRTSEQVAPSR